MAANASNFVKLNELTKEKEETEQALEEDGTLGIPVRDLRKDE